MKSSLVFILGCLPLAALSVWGLLEMATVEDPVRLESPSEAVEQAHRAAEQARAQAALERQAVDALARADLLDPGPLDPLAADEASEALRSLGAAWADWREALHTAEAVGDAARTPRGDELDALKTAASRIESMKAQVEASSLRGKRELVAALGRRLADLRSRIERIERQRAAAERIARARAAFAAEEYPQCVDLCDEVLSAYSPAIDAQAAESVRALRRRAQLWLEHARAIADLETATEPAERRLVLQKLLDNYPSREGLARAEIEALGALEAELDRVAARIETAEQAKAAEQALANLKSDLPKGFSERVRRAAEILDRHGTAACRDALRAAARSWLAEMLPQKQLSESPQLREVETTRHEIVRGFFTEVKSPHGFKRYETYEQSVNPSADVGTYLAKELLGSPAPTVLRRCVERYEIARTGLIDSPGEKERWQRLAELCVQLEEELKEYRAKPGSGREALSFAAERRFAARVPDSPDWIPLEKLFGPEEAASQ